MSPRAKVKLGCIVLPVLGVVYLAVPFVWGYAGPMQARPDACQILPLWRVAFELGYEQTHEDTPRATPRRPFPKPDDMP